MTCQTFTLMGKGGITKLTPELPTNDGVNPLQQAEQNIGWIVTSPVEGESTTHPSPEPRQLSEVSNVAADATESIARSARGNTLRKVKRAIVRMIWEFRVEKKYDGLELWRRVKDKGEVKD